MAFAGELQEDALALDADGDEDLLVCALVEELLPYQVLVYV